MRAIVVLLPSATLAAIPILLRAKELVLTSNLPNLVSRMMLIFVVYDISRVQGQQTELRLSFFGWCCWLLMVFIYRHLRLTIPQILTRLNHFALIQLLFAESTDWVKTAIIWLHFEPLAAESASAMLLLASLIRTRIAPMFRRRQYIHQELRVLLKIWDDLIPV